MQGKTLVITGGTSGLGAASALSLAGQHPSRIYLLARRASAAPPIITQIRTISPQTDVQFLHCDLADLSSVSDAASYLLAHESRLDLLMANAGVAAVPPGVTRQGYEAHLGVNHVGHALLIRKLLPLLQTVGGRVVGVTSFASRGAVWGVPLEKAKPSSAPGGNDWIALLGAARWLRYAESKLASVIYTRELATRYPEVLCVSVIPGFVETDMVAGMRFCDRVGTRVLGWLAGGMVNPQEGALNQVWAATADKKELTSGLVYEPVGRPWDMAGPATDPEMGERLWEWTEKEIASWL